MDNTLNLQKWGIETDQSLETRQPKTVETIPNYVLLEKTVQELELIAGRELTEFEIQFLNVSNMVVTRANQIMSSDSKANLGFTKQDIESFKFAPASREIETYSTPEIRETYYTWLEYLNLQNRFLIEDISSNPDSQKSLSQIETWSNMLAKSMAENRKQMEAVAKLLNDSENQELLISVSRVFAIANKITQDPEARLKYIICELKKLGIEGLKIVLDLDRTVTSIEIGGYNGLRPSGEVENDIHRAILVDRPAGLVGCVIMHGSNLMHPDREKRERAKNLYYQAGRNANLVGDGVAEFFRTCDQSGIGIYADTANLEPMGLGILHSIDKNFPSSSLIGIKGGIDFESLNKSIVTLRILLNEKKIPIIVDDGHAELVDELEGKGFLAEMGRQVLNKPLSFEKFSLVVARSGVDEHQRKKCTLHKMLLDKGIPHVTYTDDMQPVTDFINQAKAI